MVEILIQNSNNEFFIKKAENIHKNKYIYSLVNYINSKTPIKIICKKHGEYLQRPDCHLRGQGCAICSNRKLTTDIFIKKAENVHNNYYTYNKSEYKNHKYKIIITCPIHGDFMQTPSDHLSGCGCVKCSIQKSKLSLKSFINKANIIHNNFYDYSNVNFNNVNDRVKIICSLHGIFEQKVKNHLLGYGCKKCGKIQTSKKNTKYNTLSFIKKANIIHKNKYDYSDTNFVNINKKIIIRCKQHGEFLQTPNAHLNLKQGCLQCSGKNKITKEFFIEKSKIIHNNKYDYSKINFINNIKKVNIFCKKHGLFSQTPKNHLKGRGCRKCSNNVSKKEIIWLKSFNNNNIIFQHLLYTNKKKFKVDGFDPQTNTVYEFYGDYWHGNPIKYDSADINSSVNKTFGELYNNTIKREQELLKYGYKIISIWEYNFEKSLSG